jgi:hypothetical protein
MIDLATQTLIGERILPLGDPALTASGLFLQFRTAFLRCVRQAAWILLDLDTEFEALD